MLHFRFFLRILVAIILFAIFIPFFSFGDPAINIKGHYDVTYYNSSKPSGKMLHVNFSVILGTNNCEILATNQEDPNVWENVLYDGENTYLLTPSDNHLIKSDKSFTTCGLVLPGRQYYFVTISLLDTYILWIAYCLPPQNISPNMPSPVSAWRENINAYGWKWKDVLSTSDGRFLKSFCIVRDVSADLDDQKEFLRPTFQYPVTIDDYEEQKENLLYRRSIPDNWIGRTYSATDFVITNGFIIPATAECKCFSFSSGNTALSVSSIVQVDKISFIKDQDMLVPTPLEDTYIRDYRYTQRNGERMFNYAQYVGSGTWKTGNDSELKAQANYYMKYGPKFGDYGIASHFFSPDVKVRLIIIWLLLLSISTVTVVMLFRTYTKTKTK